MSDDRYFSGEKIQGTASPAPFKGRSARGYATGATTVFAPRGNSSPSRNTSAGGNGNAFAKSAAAFGTAGAFSEFAEPLDVPAANGSSARRNAGNVRPPYTVSPPSQPTRPNTATAKNGNSAASVSSRPTGSSRVSKNADGNKANVRNVPSERPRREKSGKAPSESASPKKSGNAKHTDSDENTATTKKRNKGTVILSVVLAVVILICGFGAGAVGYVLKDYKNSELKANAYVSEDKLKSSSKVTNILLMGIDTESTESSSRSDAMILMSVDSANHKIKLTSFLRDMYVTVPGHGETKLTHACSYKDGGPQLTCDTIELNFGIKIDGYAKIGYDIFREIIDAVGGITVAEIDKTESKALAEEGVQIDPGTNIHLDGKQALVYCRIRHGQSDFQRTERQRETIMLVLAKMKKTNPLKLVKLASSVASKINCSVPKSELISLAFKALPCLLHSAEQTQIPTDGAWSYGTRDSLSVVLVDFEKNKNFLNKWIYGE